MGNGSVFQGRMLGKRLRLHREEASLSCMSESIRTFVLDTGALIALERAAPG